MLQYDFETHFEALHNCLPNSFNNYIKTGSEMELSFKQLSVPYI